MFSTNDISNLLNKKQVKPFNDFLELYRELSELQKQLPQNLAFISFSQLNLEILNGHANLYCNIDDYLKPEERNIIDEAIEIKNNYEKRQSVSNQRKLLNAIQIRESRATRRHYKSQLDNSTNSVFGKLKSNFKDEKILKTLKDIETTWSKRSRYANIPSDILSKLTGELATFEEYINLLQDEYKLRSDKLSDENKKQLESFITKSKGLIKAERKALIDNMIERLRLLPKEMLLNISSNEYKKESIFDDLLYDTLKSLEVFGISKQLIDEFAKKASAPRQGLSQALVLAFNQYINEHGTKIQKATLNHLYKGQSETRIPIYENQYYVSKALQEDLVNFSCILIDDKEKKEEIVKEEIVLEQNLLKSWIMMDEADEQPAAAVEKTSNLKKARNFLQGIGDTISQKATEAKNKLTNKHVLISTDKLETDKPQNKSTSTSAAPLVSNAEMTEKIGQLYSHIIDDVITTPRDKTDEELMAEFVYINPPKEEDRSFEDALNKEDDRIVDAYSKGRFANEENQKTFYKEVVLRVLGIKKVSASFTKEHLIHHLEGAYKIIEAKIITDAKNEYAKAHADDYANALFDKIILEGLEHVPMFYIEEWCQHAAKITDAALNFYQKHPSFSNAYKDHFRYFAVKFAANLKKEQDFQKAVVEPTEETLTKLRRRELKIIDTLEKKTVEEYIAQGFSKEKANKLVKESQLIKATAEELTHKAMDYYKQHSCTLEYAFATTDLNYCINSKCEGYAALSKKILPVEVLNNYKQALRASIQASPDWDKNHESWHDEKHVQNALAKIDANNPKLKDERAYLVALLSQEIERINISQASCSISNIFSDGHKTAEKLTALKVELEIAKNALTMEQLQSQLKSMLSNQRLTQNRNVFGFFNKSTTKEDLIKFDKEQQERLATTLPSTAIKIR